MNISDDILERPQEECMQLALAAIQGSGTKDNGDPNYLARQAATHFDVPRTSIACRLKGVSSHGSLRMMLRSCKGGKTCHEAHIHEQLLTAAQEEVLAKWIKVQGRCGIPLTYTSIGMYAGEICGWQVGGSWPKRFLKCHQI